MIEKIYLWLAGLGWLLYGLYCFVQPQVLDAAGVAAANATGGVELRAMYGGLQAAVGLIAFVGIFRQNLQRPMLLALTLIYCGLGVSRLIAALGASEFSSYIVFALSFELGSGLVGIWLLNRSTAPAVA